MSRENENKKLEDARKAFKGFNVVFRDMKGENPMQILELKNPDGSRHYYIRYVFDTNGGTITISGDLGVAVVCPTWRADLPSTASVGINPGYFMEKVRCSSDRYDYDEKEFSDELEKVMRSKAEEHNENCTDEFDKIDLDDIGWDVHKVMGAYDHSDGYRGDDLDAQKALKKYGIGWEDGLYDWGKEWCSRVYLWLCGIEYAYDTLKAEGKVY